MDINQISARPTFTVGVVFDKDGTVAAGFEIVGKDSDEYRKVVTAQRRAAIRRNAAKSLNAKTDEGAGRIADVMASNETEIATAVVVGLIGFTDNGQPAPCTETVVRNIFVQRPTWQDKVLAALDDDANFTQA